MDEAAIAGPKAPAAAPSSAGLAGRDEEAGGGWLGDNLVAGEGVGEPEAEALPTAQNPAARPSSPPSRSPRARHLVLLDRICSALQVPVEARFIDGEMSDDAFDEVSHLVLSKIKELMRQSGEASMALNEWVLMKDEVPLPPYDIRSPVVSHLLSSWSKDVSKTLYVVSWVDCLSAELPEGFPRGLQLANCTSEMKDGFLLLLIPLIRHSSIHDLEVWCRRRISAQHQQQQQQQQQHLGDFIFDLRIKVAGGSRSSSSSRSSLERLSLGFPLWTTRDSGSGTSSSSSSSSSTLAADVPPPSLQQRLAPLASSIFGLLSSPFRQQSSDGPAAVTVATVAAASSSEAAEEGDGQAEAEPPESRPGPGPAPGPRDSIGSSDEALHDEAVAPARLAPATLPAPPTPPPKKVDVLAERLERLRSEGRK